VRHNIKKTAGKHQLRLQETGGEAQLSNIPSVCLKLIFEEKTAIEHP
jgi:hypothetical protein